MKTKFLTIAAIFTLTLATATSAFASVYTNGERSTKEVSTTLTNISGINKIELHGNVELYVSDGAADQVKVYNRYYSESALVQSQHGVLRIASYNAKKLVVWVTASDLQAISVYDNAAVKSFGSLARLDLEVNLYNTASASLNLNAYRASITVNDNAKVSLTGTVNDYNLKYVQPASVSYNNFIAANATTTVMPGHVTIKTKTNELAGLY